MTDYYQIEFADLHQLLSIQSDLLHVNGDREHRVRATTRRDDREMVNKPNVSAKLNVVNEPG